MTLGVLFHDSAVAVVDKPPGLPVEADSKESVVAVAARLLAPPGGRAWPRVVHRLDRGTSGCLLLALQKKAEEALLRSFEEGRIEKTYLALVLGSPPERGACDTAYGPDPRDARRHTTRIQTPRRARLSYEVVERFAAAAWLRVVLDTGRTHQIRVQLSEAGYPVAGDDVYGAPFGGLLRLALHAAALAFPHPSSGERVSCTAPLPEDLTQALVRLRAG